MSLLRPVFDPTSLNAAIAEKADKVGGATAGHLASLTAAGNLADAGVGLGSYYTKTEVDALVASGGGSSAALAAHVADHANPHAVSKAQAGLGSVADALQLVAASNLSDLVNVATARTNLGLGSLATLSSVGNAQVGTGIDAAKIGGGSVSNTEYAYLDGVTSGIQAQLNALVASIPTTPGLAAVLAVGNDANASAVTNMSSLDVGSITTATIYGQPAGFLDVGLNCDAVRFGAPLQTTGNSIDLASGGITNCQSVTNGASDLYLGAGAAVTIAGDESGNIQTPGTITAGYFVTPNDVGANTVTAAGQITAGLGVINSPSSATKHLSLLGHSADPASTDAANGVFLGLSFNGLNNRQLQVGATDGANSDATFRLYFYNGAAGIDAVSKDGMVRKDMSFGNDTTNITFGDVTPGPAAAKAYVRLEAAKSLVVRGASSQSASLQEWQNSGGTALSKVDAAGNLIAQNVYVANNSGTIAGTDPLGPMRLDGYSDTLYLVNEAGGINFRTGGETDRVTIASGGFVGIATTVPSYRLHVHNGGVGTDYVQSPSGYFTLDTSGTKVYGQRIDQAYVYDSRAFYETAHRFTATETDNVFYTTSFSNANHGWIELTLTATNSGNNYQYYTRIGRFIAINNTGAASYVALVNSDVALDPSAQGVGIDVRINSFSLSLAFTQPGSGNWNVSWHVRQKFDYDGSGPSAGGGYGYGYGY